MTTIILHGCQGAGKSKVAASLARRLGCTSVLDEWDGRQQLPRGALAITNLSLGDFRVPSSVSTLGFHQALERL
jgi:predicted kinase